MNTQKVLTSFAKDESVNVFPALDKLVSFLYKRIDNGDLV